MADTELDSQHPEGGSEATGETTRATSKQRRLMSPTNGSGLELRLNAATPAVPT